MSGGDGLDVRVMGWVVGLMHLSYMWSDCSDRRICLDGAAVEVGGRSLQESGGLAGGVG